MSLLGDKYCVIDSPDPVFVDSPHMISLCGRAHWQTAALSGPIHYYAAVLPLLLLNFCGVW